MKLQVEPHGCGAAALQNALVALGLYSVPQEAVLALAGTDAKGTSTKGIKRAAKLLGARCAPISTTNADAALAMLRGSLLAGMPMILCVDREDHWVTAIGVLGARFCIADSADGGVVNAVNVETLLQRWMSKDKLPLYYGLQVSR